jgi:hypothetical protein
MCFVFIYENRRMKPVAIVLRRGEVGRGRIMEGISLTKIYLSTYVNITVYPPVQILYANIFLRDVLRSLSHSNLF